MARVVTKAPATAAVTEGVAAVQVATGASVAAAAAAGSYTIGPSVVRIKDSSPAQAVSAIIPKAAITTLSQSFIGVPFARAILFRDTTRSFKETASLFMVTTDIMARVTTRVTETTTNAIIVTGSMASTTVDIIQVTPIAIPMTMLTPTLIITATHWLIRLIVMLLTRQLTPRFMGTEL